MTQRIAIALTCSLATGTALVLAPAMAWAQGETLVTYTGSPNSGAKISVTAAAGQSNSLVASARDANLFSFRDTSAGITAPDSPHCAQASPTEVRCNATGLEELAVDSGDRADRVQLRFMINTRFELDRLIVDTGRGNDVLRVYDRHSDISSKLQLMDIRGGSGNDRFLIQVGTSDLQNAENIINGGSGNDRLAIQVGTSDLQNAENIINGGSGNDRVHLSGAGIVRGQAGDDRLIGAGGNQRLFGGPGMDRITAGGGDDDYCDGGAEDDSGGAGCEKTVSL